MKEKQPIKIALMGTLCTGKTTLIESFRATYDPSTLVVVEEAARSFFEQNQIEDRLSFETQIRIMQFARENEEKAHDKNPEIILCDRSVLDGVVYQRMGAEREKSHLLLEGVEYWLPTYHKFLLLDPTDIPLVNDGIRTEDSEMRDLIHEEYLQFFKESGISYELISGDKDTRFHKVQNIIQDFQKKHG